MPFFWIFFQSCGTRPETVEYPPAPFHGSGKPEDNIPCDEMTDEVEGYNKKSSKAYSMLEKSLKD